MKKIDMTPMKASEATLMGHENLPRWKGPLKPSRPLGQNTRHMMGIPLGCQLICLPD